MAMLDDDIQVKVLEIQWFLFSGHKLFMNKLDNFDWVENQITLWYESNYKK